MNKRKKYSIITTAHDRWEEWLINKLVTQRTPRNFEKKLINEITNYSIIFKGRVLKVFLIKQVWKINNKQTTNC